MGRNPKEAFVFTSIMCTLMVLVMSFYNVFLVKGWTSSLWTEAMIGFLPALAVALILDVFVVGRLAKGLANRLIGPSAPMVKKVLTISFLMVCGMASCMSLFGTLAHYGFHPDSFRHYPDTLGLNFIFALPLQLLVVGPATRFLFMRLYPAGPAPIGESQAS